MSHNGSPSDRRGALQVSTAEAMPPVARAPLETVGPNGSDEGARLGTAATEWVSYSWARLTASDYWTFLKWSAMATVLFWLLVYRLSESMGKLPDFVYVNF